MRSAWSHVACRHTGGRASKNALIRRQAVYACPRETAADFSAGRAGKRIGYLLFATHPHHPGIREWFCAGTVSGKSRRRESLFTAPISCAWQ